METLKNTQSYRAAIGKNAIKRIGKRLFAEALKPDVPLTTTGLNDLVSAVTARKKVIDGSKSKVAAATALKEVIVQIHCARSDKRKLGHGWVPKPALTVAQRLDRAAERAYLENYFEYGFTTNYRFDRPPDIAWGRVAEVFQKETLDWDYYSKSCKYPKKRVYTKISIPLASTRLICENQIGCVDGLVNFDAELVATEYGNRVFRTKTLVMGRGYTLSVKEFYLAIRGSGPQRISYHGSSVKSAVAGLERKRRLARARKEQDATEISALVARNLNKTVRRSDARAVGACLPGIESWCGRVGINPHQPTTVGVVWDAYQKAPSIEAVWAIRHAISRAA